MASDPLVTCFVEASAHARVVSDSAPSVGISGGFREFCVGSDAHLALFVCNAYASVLVLLVPIMYFCEGVKRSDGLRINDCAG